MRITAYKCMVLFVILPVAVYAHTEVRREQSIPNQERCNWRFVTSHNACSTNNLQHGLGTIRSELLGCKGVSFVCSDTNGALLIQGRIMKFNTYSKLYSALYSELTHSTMPLELTLTRLEVDTANDLGDICVFSKRWDVASARFVTTKNLKFVFFTIGSFMVNVCGDEGDVLHTAKQISKWLSKNNPAAANEACVSDYTGILAVRRFWANYAQTKDSESCIGSKILVVDDGGELTAEGAWLSFALADEHTIMEGEEVKRKDIAAWMLNEALRCSPKLRVNTYEDISDALRRTIGIGKIQKRQ